MEKITEMTIKFQEQKVQMKNEYEKTIKYKEESLAKHLQEIQ